MTTDKKAEKKRPSVTLVVGDLDENSSDEELARFIYEMSGSWPDDWDHAINNRTKSEANDGETS